MTSLGLATLIIEEKRSSLPENIFERAAAPPICMCNGAKCQDALACCSNVCTAPYMVREHQLYGYR